MQRLRTRTTALVGMAAAAVTAATMSTAGAAQAKGGGDDGGGQKACDGGNFSLVLPGRTITAAANQDLRTTIPASQLGTSFLVKGKYVEFTVTTATFGVTNWTLTGVASPSDITGGHRTVVFASKTPDLRGATLTSGAIIRLRKGEVRLERDGAAASMKIQAKDCAQGGIFQIEPERADGTATVFTHTLAPGAFYYDNPNFRARIGTTVPFVQDDGTVVQLPVPARINFGNDVSAKFVGRDSAQVATRVNAPTCANAFAQHCGGQSVWSVASGGRMGQVMGEDATEVSPAATDCTADCQAQDQIRGRAVVLGNPFPVPAASRLTPRLP